jgi:hypothetical protein
MAQAPFQVLWGVDTVSARNALTVAQLEIGNYTLTAQAPILVATLD